MAATSRRCRPRRNAAFSLLAPEFLGSTAVNWSCPAVVCKIAARSASIPAGFGENPGGDWRPFETSSALRLGDWFPSADRGFESTVQREPATVFGAWQWNWEVPFSGCLVQVAGLVGYGTNVLALEMTFYPVEFWGIELFRIKTEPW